MCGINGCPLVMLQTGMPSTTGQSGMEVTSNKATKAWHQYSLKKDTKQPQLTQFLNREHSARAINKKTSIVNHNFSPFEVFRGVQDPTIKEKGELLNP